MEDIPILARHFLERFAERFGAGPLTVPPELLPRLRAHAWPGNVRELENAIESLVALSSGGALDLALLPGAGASGAAGANGAPVAQDARLTLKQRMDAYERGVILAALDAAKQNRTEAARRLGIGRATLHEKLRKLGVPE